MWIKYWSQITQNVWLAFCKYILINRCDHTERLGSEYGGWSFYPSVIGIDSIVYSIGIGEDITFDLALIDKYKCHVYAFDPTPRSHTWLRKQNLPEQFAWFDYGIADYDGQASFFSPENREFISHTIMHRRSLKTKPSIVEVKKISSVLKILNSTKIDLLKMDIEGAEHDVINNIIKEDIKPRQILVEFHHFLPEISLWKTIRSTILLCMNSYSLFYVSPGGHEYSFLYKGKSTDKNF